MTRRRPPADVAIYYDRPTRSWWAFRKDGDGHQIGDAVFAFRYNDALDAIIETAEPARSQ